MDVSHYCQHLACEFRRSAPSPVVMPAFRVCALRTAIAFWDTSDVDDPIVK